jgi:CubicO group peptidase (beta-lactamase class C family)
MSAEQVERTCVYVKRAVDEGVLPLADILIARYGRIICHHSYIHPPLEEKGHRLGCDRLFYLASFTKILVATLIMQQVERGSISLERPVAEYIHEFGQRGKEGVTVRHLLAHASGLPDTLAIPVGHVGPASEFLEAIYGQPLVFTPGTRGSYCTWGFIVLAELLRRVTGMPLEELGREQLFDPLGMSNTHFGYEEAWKDRIVPIFDDHLQVPEALNRPALLAMVRGDTGAYSTTLDLAVLCQMMLNGGFYGGARVLSPVSVQRMVERQYPWWDTPERLSGTGQEKFVHLSKGLCWMTRGGSFYRGSDLMSSRAFFHGGHLGMRAVVDPEYDLITLFMTSIVCTAPDVSAYFGTSGLVHHTFSTMAFAAVADL